jgi:hypothetical protein
MKIHIGKYKNWFGPYQLAEFLLEPLTWFKLKRKSKLLRAIGDQEDPHDALCHKFGTSLAYIDWLSNLLDWISKKRNRKVKIQIDPWDTWSMDSTLSMIILPMLKQLKEKQHGAMLVDPLDVPKNLRPKKKPSAKNDYVDDTHFKRWEWVMNELIWTFEQLNDDDNNAQFHSGESEILWQGLDKDHNPIGEPEDIKSRTKHESVVNYQMVKGSNDTHVFDSEAFKKHHDRIQNGLVLFGKYYRGLWD